MYEAYVDILKEELVPAAGCTEPIAVAYCAATARHILGKQPETVTVQVSGNILKNAKSVFVPNTGGLRGIEAATAAGIVVNRADRQLEVLGEVTSQQQKDIRTFLDQIPIKVQLTPGDEIFDIIITLTSDENWAQVRIVGHHTNIVSMLYNGQPVSSSSIHRSNCQNNQHESFADRSCLSIQGIVEFADTVDLSLVKDILDRQIAYNTAIAEEGLRGDYGANVGRVLMKYAGNDIKMRARARAAAGSDARMNGCKLPVIINCGSGNQGIAASIPVLEYAKEQNASQDLTYRALLVSNLTAIHLKTGIGRLSAYCGAVTAGCGAGAGIAYLHGGKYKEIAHTIVNALAIVSGIVCDGAKASCAGKIASAVDAGIVGWLMYQEGQQFLGGDGIVTKGVENTISNVGRLGHDGMKETDQEILRIMLDNET